MSSGPQEFFPIFLVSISLVKLFYIQFIPFIHLSPICSYMLPLMIHLVHMSEFNTCLHLLCRIFKYYTLCTCTSVIWLPHANTEVYIFYLHFIILYWFTYSLHYLHLANLTGYWAPHTLPIYCVSLTCHYYVCCHCFPQQHCDTGLEGNAQRP